MRSFLAIFFLSHFVLGQANTEEIRVQFLIDEDFLAIQTISKTRPAHGRNAEHVEAYRAVARKLNAEAVGSAQNVLEKQGTRALFLKTKTDFASFARQLRATSEFGQILSEVKEYASASQVEWEKNLPKAAALMRGITHLPFDEETRVYIMHPAVGSGVTWDQENRSISFGAYPAWNNYFTIYIWHELMHLELPGDDAAHSVIQLTTDCWLRQQLDGIAYPPFEGHDELFAQMQRFLPAWLDYLKKPDGILNFYGRIPDSEKNCGGEICD